MNKIVVFCSIVSILFLPAQRADAQQKIFNLVEIPGLDATSSGGIRGIAQDKQGYIWLTARNKGLLKYDGDHIISYVHNSKDSNSIIAAPLSSIEIDSDNNIWIGSVGGGLDKFDPATNTFTHFRHNSNNPGSLTNDTVQAILEDHSGQLWIGTYGGLAMLDRKTGRFTHYANKTNDPTSLSHNHIRALYEDRQGTLWVGCGSPFINDKEKPEDGGLNRFNKHTGKFTRFLHDPDNPNSLASNKVLAFLEDSKGNFWVGTAGDGLHTLDRRTGIFTHHYYNAVDTGNIRLPYLYKGFTQDHITFINEDAKGKIWIGSIFQGINEFDPQTKKLTHHGFSENNNLLVADTLSGFKHYTPWKAINTRDSMLWITTFDGHVYNVNPFDKIIIPYIDINRSANTFYKEKNGTLWIGTNQGLIRKNSKNGIEKIFLHEPGNVNSLSNNHIYSILADNKGKLWIGTNGGLDRFDPAKNKFTHYKKDSTNASGLSSNIIGFLYLDQSENLWISTEDSGLNKMNTVTGEFSHFSYKDKDSNSLSTNRVYGIAEDKINIWAGAQNALNQLNKATGKIKHYLANHFVIDVYVDASGSIWAGTTVGLFNYNKTEDKFVLFDNALAKINRILNIIEDNQRNLWISTAFAIFKIDEKRKNVRLYGKNNGVHLNYISLFANNYITKEGELFIGDQEGYYNFFPHKIIENTYPLQINISSFQIGGKEILPGSQSILRKPIYNSDKVNLAYYQNSFSIGFSAIDFRTPGEKRYLYMLENYDNQWYEAGADRKASFYNLPTGNFVLRIRVINSEGVYGEKTLSIIISPPWWQRWWAITIFVLAFISIVWGYFYYRSRRLRIENRQLEEKVNHRTAQLQQSLEKLKSTQAQLIQSEKMASLGELTAGIAHEIQNPLNFVNNFSEVNTELIAEMELEIDKGNIEEIKSIANLIKQNEQKINHHGKRAESIVKGMLQHSRINTGRKQPTDINALADEYLRLSYHGFRAKDKAFNATIHTNFDETIGKVNIVPQDIGRVLLNLYNNAFYAAPLPPPENIGINSGGVKDPNYKHEPTVWVSTKKVVDKVLISVRDNGPGIPQKILDKIFQPFFTTKPTGQGTGLGLSLSYDIIKAHGGIIKVETKEGEGAEFIIQLPIF